MATRPRQGIAQRLNAAQLAVVNSLSDQEIQGLVAQFGCPAANWPPGVIHIPPRSPL